MAIGSAISGIAQAVQQSDYGGQLISGGIGQIFAGANARRQWRYRQKEMKLQQQYALEQMAKNAELSYANWQKQFDYENEYNLPVSVMERYRQAGITPAAVLGSSGVGVNATMSGGSAPSFGASGPSSSFTQPAAYAGDPTASALNEMNRSAIKRNDAAADRDSAEADRINAQNVGKEAYRTAFELNNQLLAADIKDADARAKYNDAIAEWQLARNQYKDLIATADWQKTVAELALLTEEYDRTRATNAVEIPLLPQVAAANIGYILAAARSLRAGALVDEITAQDLQNWLQVNWETSIDVAEVDSDGKPTGNTKSMTGRDIASYLLGIKYTEGAQTVAARAFENWQKKHPMLIGITEKLIGGVSAGAAMRVGSRGLKGRSTTTYRMNHNGEVIGGTQVDTRMIY
jgi:hypothetical protein